MADNELMLTVGLKRCTWIPMERQTTPFGRGGGIVVELGTPYWMVNFEYQNLLPDDWQALTAWVARRRGAKSPFKAFPAMKRSPKGGATSCTAAGQANGTVTVVASPAAEVGDFVAFDGATGRAVVQLTADNGANNFNCFPPAPVGSANPEIVDPGGYFQLIGTPRMSDPFDPKKSMSFSARQVEPT